MRLTSLALALLSAGAPYYWFAVPGPAADLAVTGGTAGATGARAGETRAWVGGVRKVGGWFPVAHGGVNNRDVSRFLALAGVLTGTQDAFPRRLASAGPPPRPGIRLSRVWDGGRAFFELKSPLAQSRMRRQSAQFE